MKNNETPERYVDGIIDELPLTKYTYRFREELLEHMNDAEEDIASEEISKRLGAKDVLVQNYNDFYRGCHPKLWFLKLVFYIFLSSLVSSIASAPLSSFESTYFYSAYSASMASTLTTVCFSIFFALAVNHVLYKFIATRLSIHLEGDKRRRKLLFIFFILPVIGLIQGLYWIPSYYIEQGDALELLFYPLPFLCAFLPALSAFGLIRKRRKDIIPEAKLPYMTLVAFWVLILTIMISDRFPYTVLPSVIQALRGSFYEFHFGIFFLIDIISILPNILYIYLFHINPDSLSSPYGTSQQMVNHQIILVAAFVTSICLLGILSFRSARKQKEIVRKRWAKAIGLLLISYSLFLLLPVKSTGSRAQIDWKVPKMELSRHIEEKQFGAFYDLIKFKNSDEGYIFNYDTCGVEDSFVAVQSSGFVFTADLKNISSVEEIRTVRTETQDQENYCPKPEEKEYDAASTFFFHEGWECLDGEEDAISTEQRSVLGGCAKIAYNHREILEGSMCPVQSIDMSADKSWGLIKTACIYGTDDLYLVDLRDLK